MTLSFMITYDKKYLFSQGQHNHSNNFGHDTAEVKLRGQVRSASCTSTDIFLLWCRSLIQWQTQMSDVQP